ncbi:MAG TPA: hypothetical protein VK776_12880 [Bryobacteraceae bacterium]|jgi:Ca2+/Na+ antiporter|nr:hypothetical protein [Bryobacteraceae bacterium]
MSPRVRAYFYCVVGIGLFLFSNGVSQFAPTDFQQFFAYLALGMLSATWRVKLPGVSVNVSPVFAFVLIGIANYSLGEALIIACGSTLVQCMWRPLEKRDGRKIMFNVSAVAIGVTIAYNPSHFVLSQGLDHAPRMLPLAALVFFIINTGLVSGMIALMEQEAFRAVWRNMTQYLIWYYLAGGLLATLIIIGNRLGGWQAGLFITPFLYLAYQYYREYLRRQGVPVEES